MRVKVIKSAADLAINGAAPAFAEVIHVGRPNVGDRAAFDRYIDGMFERRWFSNNGPLVQEFERRIEAYLGVRQCVAMCNGTVALEIAIRALGLSGEVIVPSYTFVATAHALQWQGITPVFADIDPATHNVDPRSVASLINERTAGIIGVHLWGRACDHSSLQRIADSAGIALMFDGAHAFGCSSEGRMIGNFGRCEVLSFHATKFFNTFEGGAVVTNDEDLADRARLMRNFGFAGFDNVVDLGTNGKMTEVCAAMGLANFETLSKIVAVNELGYRRYVDAFSDVPGVGVIRFDDAESNNFQYIVMEIAADSSLDRDTVVAALHEENILARKYFWPGCHRMRAYERPNRMAVLPVTESLAKRVIVLPSGESACPEVVGVIRDVVKLLAVGGVCHAS